MTMVQLKEETKNKITRAWNDILLSEDCDLYMKAGRVRQVLRLSPSMPIPLSPSFHDGEPVYNLHQVGSLLLDKMMNSCLGQTGALLDFSWNSFCRLLKDPNVKLALANKAALVQEQRKEMKGKRMAAFKITHDELTGERLKKSCFAHIRSVRLYPDLAGEIWNGLIVNTSTHEAMRSAENEKSLEALCGEKGWSRSWLTDFYAGLSDQSVTHISSLSPLFLPPSYQ